MQWKIQGLNVQVSQAIANHAQKRLIDPLGRFAGMVKRVMVRLQDVDLARVHSPIRASAMLVLRDGTVLNVQQQDSDFYSAVDQLANRVRYAVRRRVDRARTKRRAVRIRNR